ncbi:hypothetical protein [Ilumatobacter sp.]|uniref:hypothetical protein n=1 Tax=Ilumatobacter sp. TaxID=1967498 RepID=UPI003753B6E3
MTTRPQSGGHDHAAHPAPAEPSQHQSHASRGTHGWMMILCGIPMLAIAAVLLAGGVVSAGLVVFVVACTAMMAFMMRGMSHGGSSGF